KIIYRAASHVLGLELFQPKCPGTCSDYRIKNFRELLAISNAHFVRPKPGIIRQLFTFGNSAEAPELLVIHDDDDDLAVGGLERSIWNDVRMIVAETTQLTGAQVIHSNIGEPGYMRVQHSNLDKLSCIGNFRAVDCC